MKELIVLGLATGAALLYWHHYNSNKIPPGYVPYYGAPVWPAMTPQIIPQVGLPPGVVQAATYYGVSSSLLETYTK